MQQACLEDQKGVENDRLNHRLVIKHSQGQPPTASLFNKLGRSFAHVALSLLCHDWIKVVPSKGHSICTQRALSVGVYIEYKDGWMEE